MLETPALLPEREVVAQIRAGRRKRNGSGIPSGGAS
jgi:hypothetical protein